MYLSLWIHKHFSRISRLECSSLDLPLCIRFPRLGLQLKLRSIGHPIISMTIIKNNLSIFSNFFYTINYSFIGQ